MGKPGRSREQQSSGGGNSRPAAAARTRCVLRGVRQQEAQEGARLLLEIPRWSFHWQASYLLAQPLRAEPGDVLRVTCRHDASLRSGKPKYVLWGEGTTDEMCLGVVQVTPR